MAYPSKKVTLTIMRIGLLQLNATVGAYDHNRARSWRKAYN